LELGLKLLTLPWDINGNMALTVGLITEAIIFIIFAFDPPKRRVLCLGKCLS
jgi:hypothetical protein